MTVLIILPLLALNITLALIECVGHPIRNPGRVSPTYSQHGRQKASIKEQRIDVVWPLGLLDWQPCSSNNRYTACQYLAGRCRATYEEDQRLYHGILNR
ncbi:hypothetical protein BDW67DRAFT_171098 [Aspergillus spinulosporus]